LRNDPPVILDGAHNPQAAEELVRTIGEVFPGMPLGLVMGMCREKDLESFLAPFAGIVRRIWAVPLRNERGRDPDEIRSAAERRGLRASVCTVAAAMREAEEWALAEKGCVCITGSLFLVGEVLGEARGAS
jgi:dihydrofolate synthase/folylpolyglutamate synthase